MDILRSILLLTGLAMCALPASGRAAVLLSENFDELTPQPSVTSVGAFFRTINGTNVDIVGDLNGSYFPDICAPPESGNCLDMDGTGGNPQGIQSTTVITLNPGVTYLLSFDLIGSQRDVTASTTVTFGPYDQTFNLASNDDTSGIVSNAVITVATTTDAFLTFASNTPGQVGDLLDNVLLTTQSDSTVPEPSSLLLFGTALSCFAFAYSRRHRLT